MLSQKYVTFIPHEHKPFWQLSQLDDFTINATANVFVHERMIQMRQIQNPVKHLRCGFLQK